MLFYSFSRYHLTYFPISYSFRGALSKFVLPAIYIFDLPIIYTLIIVFLVTQKFLILYSYSSAFLLLKCIFLLLAHYISVVVVVVVTQSCPTLCDRVDCSLPGSFVHGILQARVLEWVAIPFSKGSSWPKNWTRVSWITGRF